MLLPKSLWGLLRMPSRIALLLGAGAISAAGAQAAVVEGQSGSKVDRVPLQSAKAFGDVLIWVDAGRVYVAEPGRPAEEVRLGDTAEARLLKQMLDAEGASPESPRAVPHRMILAGSGGMGFHHPSSGAETAPPADREPAEGQKNKTETNKSPSQRSRTPHDATGRNGAGKG